MANKIAYKYDVYSHNQVAFVVTTLKQARWSKKMLKETGGKDVHIVKQQYLPIYDKVVY